MKLELIQKIIEVDLNRTKVSKKHDEIIDELKGKLTRIANKLKKLPKGDIRLKYDAEVKNLIQTYVEDAYFAGQEYADIRRGRRPITLKDLTNIQQITNRLNDKFWAVALQVEVKEFGFDILFASIARMVSDAITQAINDGTLTYASPAFPVEPLDVEKIMVTFTTRKDEKVCLICQGLDGTQYEIDDSNKPVIPDDTHYNCRCRYLI